ncbi:PRC-barrel domain-containing protein [Candidatus Endowatersipora endosymbiont of Watersipora subatra]|uniref:PRC-barrel domain-containing protein n=1 Tax=Candidatus Endowatersipora endosymbiont of Watersipora subatra TaxID=3077946 RepID=UPI00312CB288
MRLKVIDSNGAGYGKIVEIYKFGAGNILEIEGFDRKTCYLEFRRANVPAIDFVSETITINIPETVS